MRDLKPTMHPDYAMGTRVTVDPYVVPGERKGAIAGIATMNVIFLYIVLLDEPLAYDGETFQAIAVSGCQLEPHEPWHLAGE